MTNVWSKKVIWILQNGDPQMNGQCPCFQTFLAQSSLDRNQQSLTERKGQLNTRDD